MRGIEREEKALWRCLHRDLQELRVLGAELSGEEQSKGSTEECAWCVRETQGSRREDHSTVTRSLWAITRSSPFLLCEVVLVFRSPF